MKYIITPFNKIFDINSTATVKEFWVFILFYFLISIIFKIIETTFFKTQYHLYFTLLMLVPKYTLGFRRLNDAGINKFLFLIPFINVFLASLPSKEIN